MFGKKKEEDEVKEQVGELKEKPAESGKPPKVSKGFGNTIILFIVFFIVFTIIVTGVAFFADKLDISGSKDKTEQMAPAEKVTNPEQTDETKYVIDDKGNLTEEEKADEELKIPVAAGAAQTEAEKPAPKPAPLPPVKIKPEIKKEEPKPAPAPAPKPAPAKTSGDPLSQLSKKATTGPYVVQVASFKNKAYADKERDKLSKIIPDVFVVRADLGEKGVWYRVRCYNGINYQEAKAKAVAIAARTSHKPYPMKK